MLKEMYGANALFRSHEQRLAFEKTLCTNDELLVILPTGLGKSCLFYAYARYYCQPRQLTSLVITPMLSLVDDLIRRGRELGVSCSDSLDINRTPPLVFLTPESASAQKTKIATLYSANRLGRFFFDEGHLFSEFQFRNLRCVVSLNPFNDLPWTVLTGSCSSTVIRDFQDNFFLGRRFTLIRQQTNRINLHYSVVSDERLVTLTSTIQSKLLLLNPGEKMIVFFAAIDDLETVSDILQQKGRDHVTYYSTLTDQQKKEHLNAWRDSLLMLATSAFGLGIDSPMVRFVLQYKLPYSLEDYAQQAGRAGRDGKSSECILLYSPASAAARITRCTSADEKRRLSTVLEYARLKTCRRRYLSAYFDDKEVACNYFSEVSCCDNCHTSAREGENLSSNRSDINNNNSHINPDATNASSVNNNSSLITTNTRNNPSSVNNSSLVGTSASNITNTFSRDLPLSGQSQSVIRTEAEFGTLLRRAVELFENSCIICFVELGVRSVHVASVCPRFGSRCFGCLSPDHRVSSPNCPLKNYSPPDHCCACFLPTRPIGVTTFHTYSDIGVNHCRFARDALKFFAVLVLDCASKSSLNTKSKLYPCLLIHEKFVDYMLRTKNLKI